MEPTRYDLIAVGEVLVDLISEEMGTSLDRSNRFRRFPGGQVANVAWNASLLGGRAAVVGCVGADGFGRFLRRELEHAGVETDYLREVPGTPTTLVAVARHTATPDALIYRGADTRLSPDQIPVQVVRRSRAIHTSAFALSREPSRSAVLHALDVAHSTGCLISLDPNYHPALWGDTGQALKVLRRACAHVQVVKPSLDDCRRLFGPRADPEACIARFLEWGAGIVVLTRGREGSLLVLADGRRWEVPARDVPVADVTGAGDAFWAGLLVGLLDGLPPHRAVEVGRFVAERKLRTVGPMRERMDRGQIYRTLWGEAPCTWPF